MSSKPAVLDSIFSKLLIAILFFFPLGQLARLTFFDDKVHIYVYEFFVAITVIYTLFAQRNNLKGLFTTLKVNTSIGLFWAFSGAVLVGSMFFYTWDENLVAVLYFFRLGMYFMFWICCCHYFSRIKKVPVSICWAIIWVVVASLVTGLLQYFFYPNLRNLFYAGWDPHYGRVFGLFLEPVVAGTVYSMLALFLFRTPIVKNKYLRYSLITILILFALATFARSVYVGLLVAGASIFLNKKTIKYFLIAVVACSLILAILPKNSGEGTNLLRTSTIQTRFDDYKEGMRVWRGSPVFGIGYNHIRAEKKQELTNEEIPNNAAASFHSSFLVILVTSGIFGLGIFIYMLEQMTRISPVAKHLIIFLTVVSLFDNMLLHSFVLCLWGVMVAISLTLSDT